MRMLMKVSLPIAEGNAAVAERIARVYNRFHPQRSKARSGLFRRGKWRTDCVCLPQCGGLVTDSGHSGAVVSGLQREGGIAPAMNLEDLKNAAPGMESAVRKYARTARAAGA